MNNRVIKGLGTSLLGGLIFLTVGCNDSNVKGSLASDPNYGKEVKETSSNGKLLSENNNPMQKQVAKQNPAGPVTTLKFNEKSYDFGTIKQDTKNEHIFNFTNTGDNPLIISSAKGSCGCTVPQYPTEPIAPGEKGEIKVVFSSGKKKGNQRKTVTLNANVPGGKEQLTVKANVLYDKSKDKKQQKPVDAREVIKK